MDVNDYCCSGPQRLRRAAGAGHMMRFAFLALPLLAACVPSQKSAPVTGPESCPRSQFSTLIGTDVNAAILPLTLTYRTVWPGDAVTEDFVPERLNISVDDSGVVQGLSCG